MLIYLIFFLHGKWLGLKCCFVLEIIKHSPVKAIMDFFSLFLMSSFLPIYTSLSKPAAHQILIPPLSLTIKIKDFLLTSSHKTNFAAFYKNYACFWLVPTARLASQSAQTLLPNLANQVHLRIQKLSCTYIPTSVLLNTATTSFISSCQQQKGKQSQRLTR